MSPIQLIIRSKFFLTSRQSATRTIETEMDLYRKIIADLGNSKCAQKVRVPKMVGVDEDMREWSVYMILEHNTIVNRQVSAQIQHLARGEIYETNFNPKTDVMPADSAAADEVAKFEQSVDAHLEALRSIEKMRGTLKRPHPIFGPLDAHGWNCMFGFHLQLHRRQAEAVSKQISAG
ncbi:MAG: hypothetical protein AAF585_10330 [Verrucomicrobiota bacterium]